MRTAGLAGLLTDLPVLLGGFLLRYRVGMGSYCRVETFGRENLPDTPFMVCSNHTSHTDYIAIVEALKFRHEDMIVVVARDFHFDGSLRSRIFRRIFNLAPIDRKFPRNSLNACVEQCRTFIDSGGKAVVLFPEGTRSPNGRMRSFKRGTVPIIRRIGIPVVPAHVVGGFEALSRHHIIPRPAHITVRFGKPLDPPKNGATSGANTDKDDGVYVEKLRQAVARIAEEAGLEKY